MKKLILLFLIFSIGISTGFAKSLSNKGFKTKAGYYTEIPYEMEYGTIVVTVKINNKPYRFAFDTGAPLCVSQRLFDDLNLPIKGTQVVGDVTGKKGRVKIASIDSLDIGNVLFRENHAMVFTDTILPSCMNVDGLIGGDIFRKSIIQFSHANKTIIITDNAKKIKVNNRYTVPMRLGSYNKPYIKIGFKNGSNVYALFDSGDHKLYTQPSYNLGLLQKNSEVNVLKKGYGSNSRGIFGQPNSDIMYRVNFPQLTIAATTLNNVPAETTSKNYPRVGASLLHYGTVTVNYKKSTFNFEPYESSIEIPVLKAWDISVHVGSEGYELRAIWGDMPDGISVGDEVVSVDGVACEPIGYCEYLQTPFWPEGKTSAVLVVRTKNGNLKELTATLQ